VKLIDIAIAAGLTIGCASPIFVAHQAQAAERWNPMPSFGDPDLHHRDETVVACYANQDPAVAIECMHNAGYQRPNEMCHLNNATRGIECKPFKPFTAKQIEEILKAK
jgi:hypothetical protein